MGKLLESLKENKKWYPQSISIYESAIRFDVNYSQRTLKKNFAYNMQYVEYLERQLEEFNISSVLKKMTFKSYVISVTSVIELIFYVLIRKNNLLNIHEWEEVMQLTSNEKKHKNEFYKAITHLYKKVDKFEEVMIFDTLIKKVRDNKLLSVSKDTFKLIEELRKLRNKIHIQNGANTTDHDYNNFSEKDVIIARKVLFEILTSGEICLDKRAFQFLKV
ncbi:MAG: hypothetical protein RBT45_01650 [Acholeplasmataceae bacterium]|jgi:hypothetical protein|nr:hypothetical protein [Acholeplasmataceae bacterium]